MPRYAIVNGSNQVINIVIWDGVSQWSPPKGCTPVLSTSANIGCTYDPDEGTFGPTPPPDNG